MNLTVFGEEYQLIPDHFLLLLILIWMVKTLNFVIRLILTLIVVALSFACNKDPCEKTELIEPKFVEFNTLVKVVDANGNPIQGVNVGVIYQWHSCKHGKFDEVPLFGQTNSDGEFDSNWPYTINRGWYYLNEKDYLSVNIVFGLYGIRIDNSIRMFEYENIKDHAGGEFLVEHIFQIN